jgi:uncharacterized protein YqjF (DUF2071 family)
MPDAPSPLRLVGRDVLFVHWPVPVSGPFVQVNFRTYVRFDGDPGVYFRSLGAGNRADRRAPGTSPAWSASISFRGRSDPDFPATTIPS